jgi:hypothetical protein
MKILKKLKNHHNKLFKEINISHRYIIQDIKEKYKKEKKYH